VARCAKRVQAYKSSPVNEPIPFWKQLLLWLIWGTWFWLVIRDRGTSLDYMVIHMFAAIWNVCILLFCYVYNIITHQCYICMYIVSAYYNNTTGSFHIRSPIAQGIGDIDGLVPNLRYSNLGVLPARVWATRRFICMKTNFIIFTLLQLRDTRTVNCVRNTAWRRRKQTQNCAAVPCLSTRAVVIKHLSHRNLSCLPQRGLRCLRLNVRPA